MLNREQAGLLFKMHNQEGNAFFDLPSGLIKHIYDSGMDDVSQLLHHIFNANHDAVKAMLDKNCNLLKEVGDARDGDGNRYFQLLPYEAAQITKNPDTIAIVKEYFAKIDEGDNEMSAQYDRHRFRSYKKRAELSHLYKIPNEQVTYDQPISKSYTTEIFIGNLGESFKPIAFKWVNTVDDYELMGLQIGFLENEMIIADFLASKTTDDESPLLQYYGYNYNYIVMRYMENGSLIHFIQNFEFDKNEKIFYQITFEFLKGLEILHSYNIIHRDIKPDNVLVDENLHAKICDFGVSAFADQNNEYKDWQKRGSPMYFAPELKSAYSEHREITYSFASDMYAAALVVYTLFSQEFCFNEETKSLDLSLEKIPQRFSFFAEKNINVNPKERMTAGEAKEIAEQAKLEVFRKGL